MKEVQIAPIIIKDFLGSHTWSWMHHSRLQCRTTSSHALSSAFPLPVMKEITQPGEVTFLLLLSPEPSQDMLLWLHEWKWTGEKRDSPSLSCASLSPASGALVFYHHIGCYKRMAFKCFLFFPLSLLPRTNSRLRYL